LGCTSRLSDFIAAAAGDDNAGSDNVVYIFLKAVSCYLLMEVVMGDRVN
jgi:hypothetical protein